MEEEITIVNSKRDADLKNIFGKIESETLVWAQRASDYAKRPGWATLTIITFLSSTCVGLLVVLVTRK